MSSHHQGYNQSDGSQQSDEGESVHNFTANDIHDSSTLPHSLERNGVDSRSVGGASNPYYPYVSSNPPDHSYGYAVNTGQYASGANMLPYGNMYNRGAPIYHDGRGIDMYNSSNNMHGLPYMHRINSMPHGSSMYVTHSGGASSVGEQDHDGEGDEEGAAHESATQKRKGKKAHSAWILFVNEHREKVRNDFPDLNSSEQSKVLSQIWQQMDAAAKERYLDEARDDVKRYKAECDANTRTLDSRHGSMLNVYGGVEGTASMHMNIQHAPDSHIINAIQNMSRNAEIPTLMHVKPETIELRNEPFHAHRSLNYAQNQPVHTQRVEQTRPVYAQDVMPTQNIQNTQNAQINHTQVSHSKSSVAAVRAQTPRNQPVHDQETPSAVVRRRAPLDLEPCCPHGRIRKIIKLDPDAGAVSKEALALMDKSMQLFIEGLAARAWAVRHGQGSKQVKYQDIVDSIHSYEDYIWIRDDFPLDHS